VSGSVNHEKQEGARIMATVTSDVARLVVRLGVGGILAFDGYQKVMAWYRGRQTAVTAVAAATAGSTVQEPAGTSTPAGRTVSLTAGISEAVGGAMLVLGIATPATGAAAASSMALTATADASSDRFGGGYEIPAVLGICAGALAIAGPGRISVDHLIGNRLSNRPAALASLFATVGATGVAVLRRYRSGSPKQ
jgi:putative oxidoreductase